MASNTSGDITDISQLERLGLTPFAREILDGSYGFLTDSSEDCLTLNVWTKPQTGEAKKAVLLWIYGGGYVSGQYQLQASHEYLLLIIDRIKCGSLVLRGMAGAGAGCSGSDI
jgi:hypothetical protein